MTFPSEVVYEYFARKLVMMGLPEGLEMMPPMAYICVLHNGEIAHIQAIRHEIIGKFFSSENGKAHLGQAFREILSMLSQDDCIVLISEGYVKKLSEEEFNTRDKGQSLEGDPDAHEAVTIHIMHHSATSFGCLPIRPGRELQYQAMMKGAQMSGRFSTNPHDDDLPEEMTRQ